MAKSKDTRKKRPENYRLASIIREYWRASKWRRYFDVPNVEVNGKTGEIESDTINGYPSTPV